MYLDPVLDEIRSGNALLSIRDDLWQGLVNIGYKAVTHEVRIAL